MKVAELEQLPNNKLKDAKPGDVVSCCYSNKHLGIIMRNGFGLRCYGSEVVICYLGTGEFEGYDWSYSYFKPTVALEIE